MHKTTTTIAGLAAVLIAGPGWTQSTTVFQSQDQANTEVDALEDGIKEDFKKTRESRSFGGRPFALGWYGSVAATATATSGNSDTQDTGIGAKFGHFDGQNAHDFRLSYKYGKANDVENANTLSAAYDYSRFFNDNLYGYGKLSTKFDKFGAFRQDSFAGAGLGYRLVNTDTTSWAVQAGPGYRMLESQGGTKTSELAGSLESKYYLQLRDGLALTNDTQILTSSADTGVSNELGLTVAMSRSLALRTSLRTEYHSDPAAGRKSTDNTLGLSLVYSFK